MCNCSLPHSQMLLSLSSFWVNVWIILAHQLRGLIWFPHHIFLALGWSQIHDPMVCMLFVPTFLLNAIRGLLQLTFLEEVIVVQGPCERGLHRLCTHCPWHELRNTPTFSRMMELVARACFFFLHVHTHFRWWDVGIGNFHEIIPYEIFCSNPILRIGARARHLPPIVYDVKVSTWKWLLMGNMPINGMLPIWKHYVVNVTCNITLYNLVAQ